MSKRKTKAQLKADKPKRGKSSFMFYSIEQRPLLKEENPDWGFGEFGKNIGAAWKKLDADAKKKYEKLAAEDKKVAAAANAARAIEKAENSDSDSEPAPKKTKAQLKADKPKRGKSSFMFYSIEQRPLLKEENPDWGFGQFGKHIGAEWKKLDADAKKKYEKLAAEDKKVAAAANAAKAKEKESSSDEESGSGSESSKSGSGDEESSD